MLQIPNEVALATVGIVGRFCMQAYIYLEAVLAGNEFYLCNKVSVAPVIYIQCKGARSKADGLYRFLKITREGHYAAVHLVHPAFV